MTNEIEKDFETLIEEMNQKVAEATKLLKEAADLSQQAGIGKIQYFSDWSVLRNTLEDYFGEGNILPWESSNCYEDEGWNNSGCSF